MSKRKLVGPVTHPPVDAPLPPEDTQLAEKYRSMPDLIARGGIFFPTRETIRLSQPLDVSMYHKDYVVRLDNRLLNAQHIPLGATIMQMMAQNGNSTFVNSIYGWLKNTYGRTSGKEYDRFTAELHNFANATMYITDTHRNPKGFEVEGNFLNYHIDYDTKQVTIQGNTAFFRYIYADAITRIDKTVLASLRNSVSPLLYMFYASHQSFYAQPRTFRISREKLERVIGLDLVAVYRGWSKKYITQQLRQGHDRLVKAAILDRVKGWKLKNGVYIVHSAVPELPALSSSPGTADKQRREYIKKLMLDAWHAEGWDDRMGPAELIDERLNEAVTKAIDFIDTKLDKIPHLVEKPDVPTLIKLAVKAAGHRHMMPDHIGYLASIYLWKKDIIQILYDYEYIIN